MSSLNISLSRLGHEKMLGTLGHCLWGYTNRIHHGCPVEIGKSQPEGPPVPVGNEARRVSHWNGGPEGWDFPFSIEHT